MYKEACMPEERSYEALLLPTPALQRLLARSASAVTPFFPSLKVVAKATGT